MFHQHCEDNLNWLTSQNTVRLMSLTPIQNSSLLNIVRHISNIHVCYSDTCLLLSLQLVLNFVFTAMWLSFIMRGNPAELICNYRILLDPAGFVIPAKAREYVFTDVALCVCVCLSVTTITKKFVD